MVAKLGRRDKEEIEEMVNQINRMRGGLSDGKLRISAVLRRTDDSRESDSLRTDLHVVISKMTEAEEALGVAKTRLSNALQ